MSAPQPEEPQAEVTEEGVVDEAAPETSADPVAEAEARAQEYLALAQRKQAEFENFRKRSAGQAAQAEERGMARLAKELLAPLDHLELALRAAEQHTQQASPAGTGEDSAEWVRGVRSVQDEFKHALGRAGIEAFVPLGEPFDPNVHEAMAHAPIEGQEPGAVAEVYQAGYKLSSGAVLRPARVVVAR